MLKFLEIGLTSSGNASALKYLYPYSLQPFTSWGSISSQRYCASSQIATMEVIGHNEHDSLEAMRTLYLQGFQNCPTLHDL
jgi:hypothetical protein